ncbi:MAG: 4-(cytidine 5'-diphospho)-2-C-methyl-D-erythritol kinase [Burkholderiaceae bacterium]|nr:4-(cytidine 5'-diphospho)-2-C-methyl-D-erythritol kinase [Burkholderiaceae bacterium]
MKSYLNLPAPAKINLFLHIVGRRSDGMHLLQSVFQLIDLCDYIDLEELDNGKIIREGDISWDVEKDLCYRAAKLLQPLTPQKGVRITVKKNIPTGSGLGGGSSDAATVLIALNQLWNLNLQREDLLKLAVKLGADVPFFVQGLNAFVEGIGEIITPLTLPEFTIHLYLPNAKLSTAEVFQSDFLTRNTTSCKIQDFSDYIKNFDRTPWGRNDLEPVARFLSESVNEMFLEPELSKKIRLTGSGAAAFYVVESEEVEDPSLNISKGIQHWKVRGLQKHPLYDWV